MVWTIDVTYGVNDRRNVWCEQCHWFLRKNSLRTKTKRRRTVQVWIGPLAVSMAYVNFYEPYCTLASINSRPPWNMVQYFFTYSIDVLIHFCNMQTSQVFVVKSGNLTALLHIAKIHQYINRVCEKNIAPYSRGSRIYGSECTSISYLLCVCIWNVYLCYYIFFCI